MGDVAGTDDSTENIGPSASASTSSDSSTAGPSRVHIQKPRAKRITESARQRQELTNSFIELVRQEQQRDIRSEDELDVTFAALATRMRLHLNKDQREDVIQEIDRVVREAINNVRHGMAAVNNRMYMPPMQPPPMQAAPPPQAPMQQQQ